MSLHRCLTSQQFSLFPFNVLRPCIPMARAEFVPQNVKIGHGLFDLRGN